MARWSFEVESALWVFDMDGTLIDSMSGQSLRPLALEVLDELSLRQIEIVLWSAGGASYARRKAEGVGLDHFFSSFEAKERRDPDGYWDARHIVPAAARATFVDDQPHEIHPRATVLGVSPYIGENIHDRGLAAVLQAVRQLDR